MKEKKVILITGASSGIGYATAKLLLQQGNIVYCAARRKYRMKDLEDAGGKIMFLDVTDEQTVRSVADTIIENENKIDVVFANSGYACTGALETVDIEDAKQNLMLIYLGLQELLKLLCRK